MRRRPHAYATSHALERVEIDFADGTTLELVCKSVAAVPRAMPTSRRDHAREGNVYRTLLAPADLGTPSFYGSVGSWLLLERVKALALWQVGDLGAWIRVAAWLARAHRTLATRAREPFLVEYGPQLYGRWLARADASHRLAPVRKVFGRAVDCLGRLPPTVVHGELYPSNVLMSGRRVCVVDWETAGRGPGLLDVVALATGWPDADRTAIISRYAAAPSDAVEACRLILAVRALASASDWSPPPEHAHDWLGEALAAAHALERLR